MQHENSFRITPADEENNEVVSQPKTGKQCLRLMSTATHPLSPCRYLRIYVILAASVAASAITVFDLVIMRIFKISQLIIVLCVGVGYTSCSVRYALHDFIIRSN